MKSVNLTSVNDGQKKLNETKPKQKKDRVKLLLETDLAKAMEAILIISPKAITVKDLWQVIYKIDKSITQTKIEQVLINLVKKYSFNYGFSLSKTSLGYRFYSSVEQKLIVESFLQNIQIEQNLSLSSLETLAIVAYKGPISRTEINSIRGVNSDSTIRTLQLRDLITVKNPNKTNIVTLFEVTDLFLEKMSISSLDQLPPLAPYLPDEPLLDKKVI
ncbi:MAG: SMC-Scp complex subunit ScpB [Bifidobacteriaceae bacterium]|jgi:segregation and condensation protein B|nr:SMC-Scp complex subunit ScpB [Bifidobacteriaceae bacterium]